MMLIALSTLTLVALVCNGVPARVDPPPLHVTVWVAADVPVSLGRKMTEEADAIWRGSGITFVWEEAVRGRAPATVQIIVNDDRGKPAALPSLGWILFDAHDVPDRLIHVSYANAVALFDGSGPVIGNVNGMPIAEREMYLGRAMGRALAHELGHYLFASKAHTDKGLMRRTLSAAELFSSVRSFLEPPASASAMLVAGLRQPGPKIASP